MVKDLHISYDEGGDVLYAVLGEIVPVEGDGLPGGVELDFAQEDGRPVGVTVIGYRRNHWTDKLGQLVTIMSQHLAVDRVLARREIRRAVG